VESLTIKNLQDWVGTELYECEDFKAIRSRLKKLGLQIESSYGNAEPESENHKPGFHRAFNIDLPQQWLLPLQLQLTRLMISTGQSFWGFWPFCDLRQVYFPSLTSLCFERWTIVDDWQIEWLISHGPTLRELILNGCPIVVFIGMDVRPAHWPELEPIYKDG
ncbi:hypothetical protein K491DRAFT_564751, partial [Lophiostoma macrostomum CBS 122681]